MQASIHEDVATYAVPERSQRSSSSSSSALLCGHQALLQQGRCPALPTAQKRCRGDWHSGHCLFTATMFLGTLYSVSRWGRLSHESSTRIKAFTCSTHGGYTGLLRRGIVPQFQRFRSFAMIVERISPEEAHRRKQCGECDLHLDVRTPEEYQEVHAPDSLLVPYMLKQGDKMVPNPNFLSEVEKLTGGNLERKLIVNCASGRRSAMAAEELSKKGYKVIADMEGGIQQYLQKPHLPVNRPKSQ